jgi:hypothetical protein
MTQASEEGTKVLQHVQSNLVASIDGIEFVSWTKTGLVRMVELEAEVG